MLNESSRTLLGKAAAAFENNMTPEAFSYLAQRGITEQAARVFHLGVVSDPTEFALDWSTAGRISIPYHTRAGVVGMKFRAWPADEQPKYLSWPGIKPGMFNVGAFFTPSPVICVCEGELDTIVVDGVCGIPAVGLPGVSTWQAHHPRMFEGYERVLVIADNDEKENGSNPGRDLGERIVDEVEQARLVVLPPGMDASEFVVGFGVAEFRDLCGV